MVREAQSVHRLTDGDFQAALKLLKRGKLPPDMLSVAAHVRGTVKELIEYTEAVTECAVRLDNQNGVLRDILDKAGVRYENTPEGPRKIINREDFTT